MAERHPEIDVLATGGTIANPRDIEGYLSGEELLNEVPEVGEVANISVTDVASTGSSGISPEIWWDLHEAITKLAEGSPKPDGIVITHGSNTLEETAYFLQLTVNVDIPIVLTAAQRNHRLIGNDGDRNLLDAVRVAGEPQSRGRGVLVVVNDEIHSARAVTKVVSSRPDAWSSGNLGVLGLLDKRDGLKYYRSIDRRHTTSTIFDLAGKSSEEFPRVQIIPSAAGMDGSLIHAAIDTDPDGLVVSALPTGTPAKPVDSSTQVEALEDALAQDIPVALSHRGFDGWPYKKESYIWGDTLTPQKTRILLGVSLMHTSDEAEIQEHFTEY